MPQFYELGGASSRPGRNFAYQDCDAHCVSGTDPRPASRLAAMNLNQEEWNQSLNENLAERSLMAREAYRLGPGFEFQEKAFVAFAARCRRRPGVLLRFLRDQSHSRFKHCPAGGNRMPVQTEKDYDDLSHINEAGQTRFSEYMAGVLEKLIHQK